jgi:hypothetical protein
MAYNKKAHLLTNTEAIRIAFELDRDFRMATPAERAVLRQYSGFGGIKCILKPAEKETDIAHWTKSDADLFPLVADLHRLIRENSKDEKEYKQFFNSLKSSILTAFYTPSEIVQTLSETFKNNDITPVRFLEPSAGNGAFVDAFKNTFPEMETVCFEKDLLTGKILSHLNPHDKVHVRGFEEIENRPDKPFDVVTSNIPFGDVAVFDASFAKSPDAAKRQAARAVHNYFFIKGIETLREGGLLAYITSQGVMNSPSNEPIREWLMKNANLVSAVRLPNNLMSENAGTEVGSDLIILQKNSAKTSLTPDETLFLKSRTLSNGANINNYYHNLSRVVHTKGFADKDLYGKPDMTFLHEGGITAMANDLRNMLADDFSKNLNQKLYHNPTPPLRPSVKPAQTPTPPEEVKKTIFQPKIAHSSPQSQSVPKLEQQPVISLYDLFGITEKERQQIENKAKTKLKNKRKNFAPRPGQANLFSQPQRTAQPQNTAATNVTPQENSHLQQHNSIKEKHKDAIPLIRTGDEYRVYGDDAITVANLLGLTINKENETPITVFPANSLDLHLPQLVRAGKRVAVADAPPTTTPQQSPMSQSSPDKPQ